MTTKDRPTSTMLSHSESSSTPFSSTTRPDTPVKITWSPQAVLPEVVYVVMRTPSTRTSIVTCLSSPSYMSGSRQGMTRSNGDAVVIVKLDRCVAD